jgi:exodeoxyribonuclease VII large subunit
VGAVDPARLGARAQELPLRRSAADRSRLDLFSPELDEPTGDLGGPAGEPAEPTYTVSQLGAELRDLLREAYAAIWVAGELQRLTLRPNGHRYFELVEKGEGDRVVGKLDAVIWKGDFARIAPVLAHHGQALREGVAVRCRVAVDFYPPHGRLQLQVKEIDPIFTLGELARRRQETLDELARLELLDANRARPLPALPLAVALVTSHGSAAYHDFVSTLGESGYGFRVTLLHAAMQGAEAERTVASALAAAAGLGVDCVALVRGGGAKSDLAAFDSRSIALAVARSPLPVLTGLGHEIDVAVADRVAHQSFKTPTKVAEFLVARLESAELAAARLRERLGRSARLPLAAARERLADAERRTVVVRGRLAEAASRLTAVAAALARAARRTVRDAEAARRDLGLRLGRGAPRSVERAGRPLSVATWRLVGAARGRLDAERARLEGRARLVAGLTPARTLARGFSITRTATGAIVRVASAVAPGERLVTTVARGAITSRVEET